MTTRPTVVVAVLACVVACSLWLVAPSEARARNGLIAYSQDTYRCDDGGCESYVWTVRPDGSGRRRLACSTTDNPKKDACVDILPVFAPGGGRLATATFGVADYEEPRLISKDIVAVRKADGRVLNRIPKTGSAIDALAWSADATRLALATHGKILEIRTDGTGQRRLFPRHRAGDLAWSRGGRLAWTGTRGLRVTNKARARVRNLRVGGSSIAWSPTGRRLAYIEQNKLFTISPNGHNRRKITGRCTGSGTASDVAWSPDGRQLLCSIFQDKLIAVNVRTRRIRVVVRGEVGKAITSFDWQRARRRR